MAEHREKPCGSRAASPSSDAVIPMTVDQIVLDPRNQTPIVILINEDERLALPIWIGPYEATAILLAVEEVALPRPMPHDLMLSLVQGAGARIDYVVIHEVKQGAFRAEIVVVREGVSSGVDSRPSDAIALALRAAVPILAERSVCDGADAVAEFLKEAQAERYRAFLDSWEPADGAKYKI